MASTAVAFGAFASTFCFAVASVADFVFSAEEACAAGLEEVLPSDARCCYSAADLKLPRTVSNHQSKQIQLFGLDAGLCADKQQPQQRWKLSCQLLLPALLFPLPCFCQSSSFGWKPSPAHNDVVAHNMLKMSR